MLKSLFSGVSGLQAHQIAMDVESNNIANVNTTGFKYSRANFSDMLAQTNQIATAPQGELGGKNAVQVGLGASISSVTRIHSQGSIQNTDKNTDVAIQGEGYFIVSPDGGSTYKYTRSGDFKFDASGNFVDNNGFVSQGWMRDEETGKVDSTAPITNIVIPPGLTTPANATNEVVLKANLNSGPNVENFTPAYQTDTTGATIDSLGNTIPSGNFGVLFNDSGEAFNLQDGQGIWGSFISSTQNADVAVAAGNAQTLDLTFTNDTGTPINITSTTPTSNPIAQTATQNAQTFAAAINARTAETGVEASVDNTDPLNPTLILTNPNDDSTSSHNIRLTAIGAGDDSGFTTLSTASADPVTTAYRYLYSSTGSDPSVNVDKKFLTIADLRQAMQNQAEIDIGGTPTVIINEQGKFEVSNISGVNDMSVKMTGFTAAGTSENTLFTRSMQAMNAALPATSTGQAISQAFNAATHSSSIDIYDSLGTKHTLRMEFRKTDVDTTTGSSWAMTITVPEPASIDTVQPLNEKKGQIRFNNDGSLATFAPPNLSFTANNGSAPNQQVNLTFGTSNAFDGMTSFDSKSSTSGISQDGFTGGDLLGIRIDQSGTLVGSFSNGRSFGLAQIAMAKFANNEGLTADGGNVFLQSANSGNPIIGEAATAGRGFIQSSALEASNVDLSKSLTQLIIIQRGFQANGKTITTSDQLLQTLIGLKQ